MMFTGGQGPTTPPTGRLWQYGSDATSDSGDPIAPVVGGTVFFPSAGLSALRTTGD